MGECSLPLPYSVVPEPSRRDRYFYLAVGCSILLHAGVIYGWQRSVSTSLPVTSVMRAAPTSLRIVQNTLPPARETPKPLLKKASPIPEGDSTLTPKSKPKPKPKPKAGSSVSAIAPIEQPKAVSSEPVAAGVTVESPVERSVVDPAPQLLVNEERQQTSLKNQYLAQLMAWIDAKKHYPLRARRKGIEGQVMLEFTVNRQGKILAYRIINGSGSATLDQAATSMVEQASDVPPFPVGYSADTLTVRVPVQFRLSD